MKEFWYVIKGAFAAIGGWPWMDLLRVLQRTAPSGKVKWNELVIGLNYTAFAV